mgnify:CR=1 FL=1|jgi:hypothetical protein|tara:strand:+ start:699 stop:875 length:177 start_codon:yes stop_codon:yes gene_type:complete
MNVLSEAKQRVALSLLSQVNVVDKYLEDKEAIANKDKLKSYISHQAKLLNRLEKVILQ